MNEAKLILQMKKGKTSALESIIEMYTPYVSTIIRNVLRGYISCEDLEELTADVFLSLWRHTQDISSDHLSGYLASIARTNALNYMRRNVVVMENIEDSIIVSDDNVEDETVERELSEIIKEVVMKLPDKEREIMLRFYYYGQKISEISDDMGMNGSTVKTKLYRSRKTLRNELEKRGYGYEENEFK